MKGSVFNLLLSICFFCLPFVSLSTNRGGTFKDFKAKANKIGLRQQNVQRTRTDDLSSHIEVSEVPKANFVRRLSYTVPETTFEEYKQSSPKKSLADCAEVTFDQNDKPEATKAPNTDENGEKAAEIEKVKPEESELQTTETMKVMQHSSVQTPEQVNVQRQAQELSDQETQRTTDETEEFNADFEKTRRIAAGLCVALLIAVIFVVVLIKFII